MTGFEESREFPIDRRHFQGSNFIFARKSAKTPLPPKKKTSSNRGESRASSGVLVIRIRRTDLDKLTEIRRENGRFPTRPGESWLQRKLHCQAAA